MPQTPAPSQLSEATLRRYKNIPPLFAPKKARVFSSRAEFEAYLKSKYHPNITPRQKVPDKPFQLKSFTNDWKSTTGEFNGEGCGFRWTDQFGGYSLDNVDNSACPEEPKETYDSSWAAVESCEAGFSYQDVVIFFGYPIFDTYCRTTGPLGCSIAVYSVIFRECCGSYSDSTGEHFICAPSGDTILAVKAIIPGTPEGYEPVTKPVFSPRNGDEKYNGISFDLEVTGNNIMPWAMDILHLGSGELIHQEITPQEAANTAVKLGHQFSGYVSNVCLTDGTYSARVYHPGTDDSWSDQFYVDNTPPIVVDYQALETQVSEDPPEYTTEVSFVVKEPQIDGAYSGLRTSSLEVFLEPNPFYSLPILDEAGFWITGLQEDVSVETLNALSAKVSFSVPYRLEGYRIEVSVEDQVANQARYIIDAVSTETVPSEGGEE